MPTEVVFAGCASRQTLAEIANKIAPSNEKTCEDSFINQASIGSGTALPVSSGVLFANSPELFLITEKLAATHLSCGCKLFLPVLTPMLHSCNARACAQIATL
jgi:hypothetical protein